MQYSYIKVAANIASPPLSFPLYLFLEQKKKKKKTNKITSYCQHSFPKEFDTMQG